VTLRAKIVLSHLAIILVAGLIVVGSEYYDRMISFFLVVVGIITILAIFSFGVALSNHVTSALNRVVGAAQAIAAGDLGYRIPGARGTAELDSLVRSFNHMADRLEENIRALRESEEKYYVSVRNVNNGILIIQDEKIIFSNRAFSSITGFDEADLLGMHYLDFVVPESRDFIHKRCTELVRGEGEPVTIETRHVGKDGRIGYLEVIAGLIEHKNKKAALIVLKDITERRKYIENLRRLSDQVIQVQEEERKRIAHELHDEIGQSLTAIRLSVDLLLRRQELPASSGSVSKTCEDIKVLVAKTTDDIHRISSDLRPYVLDNLGLVPALTWYLREFQERSGIKVELQVEGPSERLSPALETLVYRVTQEALTNTLKHAKAENVLILLSCNRDMLKIVIEDDGRGFDVEGTLTSYPMGRAGLGIFGMRERVSAFGGTFSIVSARGDGVRITIELASPSFGEAQGGMYEKDAYSSR
jgi:PAS domain S-box-containing protein